MNVKTRMIEVDAETADLLEARAASLGMSVSTLLADIAGAEGLCRRIWRECGRRARVRGRRNPWKKTCVASPSSSESEWAHRGTRLRRGFKVGARGTSVRRLSRANYEARRLAGGDG